MGWQVATRSSQRIAEVSQTGKQAPQSAEDRGLVEADPTALHGTAVLNATFGGDAGPWQKAAEQAVGLAVDPVWDGAGAQVGQCGAQVLDVV